MKIVVEFFVVKTMTLKEITIEAKLSDTIGSLKEAIRAKWDIPRSDQYLYYRYTLLADSYSTLWECQVVFPSTVLNLYLRDDMWSIRSLKHMWPQEYKEIRSLNKQILKEPTNLLLRAQLDRKASFLKSRLRIEYENPDEETETEVALPSGLRHRRRGQ
ncbi:hypothetical protein M3Y95_00793900 [Aphelenchoides besseyi]|nr:hypothetical protein M3Y95_00793900 [Aphelenchoides besseyi]